MTELIDIDGGACGKPSLMQSIQKHGPSLSLQTATFSGGPFRMVIIGMRTILISRQNNRFLKVADSGNKRIQSFCGTCGSQLFASDDKKSIFSIRGGCISQHHELSPVKHIFGQQHYHGLWISIDIPGLEKGLIAKKLPPPRVNINTFL